MRFQLLAVALVAAVIVPLSLGNGAQPEEKMDVARDIAARVGQILGSAGACRDIAPARIQSMDDKLQAVFNFATSSPADLTALKQTYDKNRAEGQRAVTGRQKECGAVEHDLADLENAIKTPPMPAPGAPVSTGAAPQAAVPVAPALPTRSVATTPFVTAPAPTNAAAATTVPAPPAVPGAGKTRVAAPVLPIPAPAPLLVPANLPPSVQGVTANEIRFGIVAPFSGTTRELGQQMKLGIDVAFGEANAHGGANGRMLRLMAADDGYEPRRTLDAMRTLYDSDKIFGIIGNVGTPTAEVALPFALEHRMLFYGAFTGANLLRRDPPDRYVFNYRPSYAEETDAVVRYLVRVRKLRPEQIAVFAQQDAFGDSGFAGVAKAMRSLRGGDGGTILRLGYKRNTIDVDDAVAQLRQRKGAIKAVVMVAAYRAAAKFIEKTREAYPSLIYTNVSFVGASALAEELMLLGPRFANGVIVTQVVPPVDGYSSVVLDYKKALAAYALGESPDYVSFEGYLSTKVLVEALRRTVPQFDTEHVVDALESLHDFDIGLGVPVSFGRTEHQALHKVWGTQLDANGKYQPIDLE